MTKNMEALVFQMELFRQYAFMREKIQSGKLHFFCVFNQSDFYVVYDREMIITLPFQQDLFIAS